MSAAGHFDRALLPPPRSFYQRELPNLGRPSRGWARTACPFHRGNNPTAFAVNLESGGFHCHNCGVKGGDLIDFVMRRDHISFVEAAKALGALDDTQRPVTRNARNRNDQQALARWEQAERELRRQYRDEIHLYEGVYSLFLRLLRNNRDDDKSWAALGDTLEPLRRSIAGYYILAFAAVKTRWHFLKADATGRGRMITETLNAGFVLSDDDRHVQVVMP